MPRLTILSTVLSSVGWAPIRHMVDLAGLLLDAEVIHVTTDLGRFRHIPSQILGRRRRAGASHALVIAMQPAFARAALGHRGWRSAFDKTAIWTIDSFKSNWIRAPEYRGHFDRIFVTRANDAPVFEATTGIETRVLPWGTDALGLGSADADRPIDVLRVGRQPPVLDDDAETARAMAAQGLAFEGRPPETGPGRHLPHLFDHYRRAKFVLASTNLLSSEAYVHKTEEYVTGRWTDALAAGCVVAGVPPTSDMTFRTLFWPEATLEIPLTSLDDAASAIASATAQWSPAIARLNHRRALERLDWRWRLAEIADYFELPAPKLRESLDALDARIRELT